MRITIGISLLILTQSSCVKNKDEVALGVSPVQICNSFIKSNELIRSSGADFETGKTVHGSVTSQIYVGLHPEFPDMNKIRQEVRGSKSFVFLRRFEREGGFESLYAFPTTYGFPAYVHLSVSGPLKQADSISKKIGQGFKLCKSKPA